MNSFTGDTLLNWRKVRYKVIFEKTDINYVTKKSKEAIFMRIDAYNQISQVYGVNGKYKTNRVSKTSATDKLEISSFGKELQIAKQALKDAPDVREDKVASVKSRLQDGTYEVSGEKFADKLLGLYREING